MRGRAVAAGRRAVQRPGTAGLAVAAAYLLVAAAMFALHLLSRFPILMTVRAPGRGRVPAGGLADGGGYATGSTSDPPSAVPVTVVPTTLNR